VGIVPDGFDTVIVARVERVGFTDRGGPLHRWAIVIRVERQLAGAPLPETIALYVHSPVQEFPGHVGRDAHAADYAAPLIGTRWAWALETSGTTITRQRRLFGYQPPTDAELAALDVELS